MLLHVIAGLAVLVPASATPALMAGATRRLAGSRVRQRVNAALAAAVSSVGRLPTAAVMVLAGTAAVVALCWPMGEALASLEAAVDWPALQFVMADRNPAFETFNWFYTALGDRQPLMVLSLVAALGFACLWRRRWWIPALAMLGQFVLEQYAQTILAVTVNRGHPPTGLGTYPSGGVARIVMTFGTIALLATLTWGIGPRGRAGLATLVAVAATYEGYSRLYTGKHWLTDAIGGLIFGPLLFAGFAVGVCILAGRIPAPTAPGSAPTAPGSAPTAPGSAPTVASARRVAP